MQSGCEKENLLRQMVFSIITSTYRDEDDNINNNDDDDMKPATTSQPRHLLVATPLYHTNLSIEVNE